MTRQFSFREMITAAVAVHCLATFPILSVSQDRDQDRRQKLSPEQLAMRERCESLSRTTCEDCYAVEGCAYCLESESCVLDAAGACKAPEEHVGRIEGATGRCSSARYSDENDEDGDYRNDHEEREQSGEVEVIINCPEKHKNAKTCEACTAVPGCAWCIGENKCVDDMEKRCMSQETHVGRTPGAGGKCSSEIEIGDEEYCKSKSSCKECRENNRCAWCIKDAACVVDLPGKCRGPDDHVGSGKKTKKRCPGVEDKIRRVEAALFPGKVNDQRDRQANEL